MDLGDLSLQLEFVFGSYAFDIVTQAAVFRDTYLLNLVSRNGLARATGCRLHWGRRLCPGVWH